MRVLSLAACLVLLGSGSLGCATPYDPRALEAREDGIREAHGRALQADDPWQREMWAREYSRRVTELEQYHEWVQAERGSRAEHWRQLSFTLQQAGLVVLEEVLWRKANDFP